MREQVTRFVGGMIACGVGWAGADGRHGGDWNRASGSGMVGVGEWTGG